MDKRRIFAAFIEHFEKELALIEASARAAREAATHEESKAEDSHDTRGVEASYLAGAQAARAEDIKQVILDYKRMGEFSSDRSAESIAVGAVVKMQMLDEDGKPRGKLTHSLVALRGGGASIEIDGRNITVLTPNSPLGEAALGAQMGDEIEIESKSGTRSYLVTFIQ